MLLNPVALSLSTGLLLTTLLSVPVKAAGSPFGEPFVKTPPVVNSLAQVIYWRNPGPSTDAAHVYLDGEYHTSLKPGGFTSFCVTPGTHALGAFLNDAPRYLGKGVDGFTATLSGGKTYYVVVNEQQNVPKSVRATDGLKALGEARRQVHLLSRAASVTECVYDTSRTQESTEYLLDYRLLFGDVGGQTALTEAGRNAVSELAVRLRQRYSQLNRIEIRFPARDAEGAPVQSETIRLQTTALREQLTLSDVPDNRVITDASRRQQANPQSVSIRVQ